MAADTVLSPNTREAAEKFSRAAESYTAAATKSPATAVAALVELGIYTRDGKLTKNYSK